MPDAARDRTSDLAHYIVANTSSSDLCEIKLCKIMWFSDVLHYRRHGKTISGQASYVRQATGPVPNEMHPALDDILSGKSASAVSFEDEEMRTIHETISDVMPRTAQEVSEATHDKLWESLLDGEQMSVAAAAVIPETVTAEDLALVRENATRFDHVLHSEAENRI